MMIVKNQPDGLKPGIYFNLPEKAYRADPALSASGMTKILESYRDYWETSPLNPHREEKTTEAMDFGKKHHMLLLEPDVFHSNYIVTGQKWDKNKRMINRTEWEKLKKSTEIIKANPDAAAYLENGYPEVSMFWVDPESGVRLKARVDWLRTFGCVDFKRSKEIKIEKLGFTVAQFGYDIQNAVYRTGLGIIKSLVRDGKAVIQGEVRDDWITRFATDEATMFVFFIQRSTPPYVFEIIYFDAEIMANADVCMREAINMYKHGIETWGVEPWPYGDPTPKEMSIYQVPNSIFKRGLRNG